MKYHCFCLLFKKSFLPGLGGSAGWSVVQILQGWGFDLCSGHMQESTNECINKWSNKAIYFSLSKSINEKLEKKELFLAWGCGVFSYITLQEFYGVIFL